MGKQPSKEKVQFIVHWDIFVKQLIENLEDEFRGLFNGRKDIKPGTYRVRFNMRLISRERQVNKFLKKYKGQGVTGKFCKWPIEVWPGDK